MTRKNTEFKILRFIRDLFGDNQFETNITRFAVEQIKSFLIAHQLRRKQTASNSPDDEPKPIATVN